MKKLAVTALSLFLVLSPSQAKTTAVTQALDFRKRSDLMNRTLTKNVRVLAAKKVQRRLLVTNDLTNSDDGPPGPDELDLQSPYRRPKIVETPGSAGDVSDYVAVRLAVGRARAMEAYRQKWA